MGNLEIYEKLRLVPKEALKEIGAGRLKGMSDINPMWRLKTLTETFGICGIGWKYVITSKRLEKGCNEQISAFVDIDLFIKQNDVWSDAIPGTGGSSFVTLESKGLYQSDECFKMALTDAISVACKALGMGADVYFAKDRTKYDAEPQVPKIAAIVPPKVEAPVPKSFYDTVDGCTSSEQLKKFFESTGEYQVNTDFRAYVINKGTQLKQSNN